MHQQFRPAVPQPATIEGPAGILDAGWRIGGSMGYGVPSAVAAKIVHPDRPVVAVSGDGCFLMNGQEPATARRYGAKVLHIVVNNGIYGTIRMNQEKYFPERVIGTELFNPDFVTLARAYGMHGEAVTTTAEFELAFERAWQADAGALIDVRVDPDAIVPHTTLSRIRAEAQRPRS